MIASLRTERSDALEPSLPATLLGEDLVPTRRLLYPLEASTRLGDSTRPTSDSVLRLRGGGEASASNWLSGPVA